MSIVLLARRTSVSLVGAALLAGVIDPALAIDAADVVKRSANRMLQVLRAGASDTEREATMSAIMHEAFDLPEIGRRVLGRHWKAATSEQQRRFLAAFSKAEVKAYSARFKQYGGQILTIGKVTANGAVQMVESQIEQSDASPLRLLWEVQNGKIVDVVVDGMSFATTRRADFNAFIQRNGIEGLIGELERRSR